MIKQNNVSINTVGYIMILLLLIPNECKIKGNYAIYYLISILSILMIFMLKGKIRIPPLLKHIPYTIYYVVIFLLYLFSGSTIGAVLYLVQSFCIVFLMYNSIRDCDDGDRILAFVARICGCLAILGIIETFTGFNIFDFLRNTTAIETDLRFGLHRSRGMMVVPHNYGAFLMFASIVVFYVWQKEKNFKAKRMYCVIYILVFINEMLTFTRATMAAFIVLQVTLGVLSGKITKPIRILQGVAVVAIGWIAVEVFDISIIKNIFNNFTQMFLAVLDPSTASSITNIK